MHRLRPRGPHRRHHLVDHDIRLIGRRRADMDRLVGHADVQRVAIGVGIDRHRLDAHLAGRLDHAAGNLAPVGNQDLVKHRRPFPSRASRSGPVAQTKTPPGHGAPMAQVIFVPARAAPRSRQLRQPGTLRSRQKTPAAPPMTAPVARLPPVAPAIAAPPTAPATPRWVSFCKQPASARTSTRTAVNLRESSLVLCLRWNMRPRPEKTARPGKGRTRGKGRGHSSGSSGAQPSEHTPRHP